MANTEHKGHPAGISPRVEQWITRGLIAAFVIVALIYSSGPINEGVDETAHYIFAREIYEVGITPHVEAADPADLYMYNRYEHNQPPLYYMFAGTLKLALPDPDFMTL